MDANSREFTAKLRARKTWCFSISAGLGLDSIEDLPTKSLSERGPALELLLMGEMILGASTAQPYPPCEYHARRTGTMGSHGADVHLVSNSLVRGRRGTVNVWAWQLPGTTRGEAEQAAASISLESYHPLRVHSHHRVGQRFLNFGKPVRSAGRDDDHVALGDAPAYTALNAGCTDSWPTELRDIFGRVRATLRVDHRAPSDERP